MATITEQLADHTPAEDEEGFEMTLDISPELRTLLARLAIEAGGTEFDVIGKAIALYEVAADARRSGKRIGIFDEDLELDQEIVGL